MARRRPWDRRGALGSVVGHGIVAADWVAAAAGIGGGHEIVAVVGTAAAHRGSSQFMKAVEATRSPERGPLGQIMGAYGQEFD